MLRLFDLHCDTIYQMYKRQDKNLASNPKLKVDLDRLEAVHSLVQCFALFNDDALDPDTFATWLEFAAFHREVITQYPDRVRPILTAKDIELCLEDGKVGAMMTVEDARLCLGDLDRLNIMHDLGVRMLSLCWNGETCFAYPNNRDDKQHALPLKKCGIEAVERLNELNIIVDVSHLNRGGTLDVLKTSKQPVIASHSNARAITNHPRNLSDEEIRGIAESGGVIGINFYPGFLDENCQADLEKTIKHVEYLRQLGGDGVLAIGTDFDGFTRPHQSLNQIGDMPLLAEALELKGYSPDFIEGIFYKNALRTFKEVIG